MKKFIFSLVMASCLFISLPGYGQMGYMTGRSMMNMSTIRHQYVRQHGLDPRYASESNPLEATAGNIEAGKQLYEHNCALCHGVTGLGDGVAGQNLNPPPTNISTFSKMAMATDGYLYWTIAEGGTPLGTAMPAFKESLNKTDIWKIILYLRKF